MRRFLVLTILAIMLSIPVYAGSFDDSSSNGENIRDYYFSFGLGTSFNKYNDEPMGDSNADKTSIFIDFAFYIPMDEHLLVGATISGAADRFTDPDNSDNFYQVNTYLFGGSALYFLNYIEEGLFFRGDLGFSKMAISYEINGHSDSASTDKWGLGVLAGVGYSMPFETFSLTGNLLFSHKEILDSKQDEDLTVTTVSLSLGVLF
jgi:hypothetical protein